MTYLFSIRAAIALLVAVLAALIAFMLASSVLRTSGPRGSLRGARRAPPCWWSTRSSAPPLADSAASPGRIA